MSSFIFHYQDLKEYYSPCKSGFLLSLLAKKKVDPNPSRGAFSWKLLLAFVHLLDVELLGKTWKGVSVLCGVFQTEGQFSHSKYHTRQMLKLIDTWNRSSMSWYSRLVSILALSVLCIQMDGDYIQTDILPNLNQDKISGLKDHMFREPL